MNRNNMIITSIIILLGLAVFLVSALSKQTNSQLSSVQENTNIQIGVEQLIGEETNGKLKESTNSSARGMATNYVSYSQQMLTTATKNNGRAVIFFQADWCPFCREAEGEFLNNIPQIPSDVTILKADYDKETELKKKYAVISQHTFVQVDADGNEITRWVGGGIKELLQNIKGPDSSME